MASMQRFFSTSSSLARSATARPTLRQTSRLLVSAKYSTVTSTPVKGSSTGNPATIEKLPSAVTEQPTLGVLPDAKGHDGTTDWSRSYSGLSTQPFPKEVADILLAPLDPLDVEMKPGKFLCNSSNLSIY